MSKQKGSLFWASYADLMTSLFFIMLILFAAALVTLNNAKEEALKTKEDAIERSQELQALIDKANEINNATRELDTKHSHYFQY